MEEVRPSSTLPSRLQTALGVMVEASSLIKPSMGEAEVVDWKRGESVEEADGGASRLAVAAFGLGLTRVAWTRWGARRPAAPGAAGGDSGDFVMIGYDRFWSVFVGAVQGGSQSDC